MHRIITASYAMPASPPYLANDTCTTPPQHAHTHTHTTVQNILWSRDKLLVLLRGKGQEQQQDEGENEGKKGL